MATPPDDSYEAYSDGDGPGYRPKLPVPPVAANTGDAGYGDSIPKAWDDMKDNAQVASKAADSAWPDGTGEVADIGTPFVSADSSGNAEPPVQTYDEAVDELA